MPDPVTAPAAPLSSRRAALEELHLQATRDLEAMRARLTARRLERGLPPAPRE